MTNSDESVLDKQPENSAADDLDFSVIIALQNHRGHWRPCIASWTGKQDYPRHKYEVIIGCDGSEPGVESEVEKLLGRHDRLVRHSRGTEMASYDFAARQARGRYLFMTEAHALGSADCLSKMMEYLSVRNGNGAMCKSREISTNQLGQMEERFFQDDLKSWSAEGHWRRMAMRGVTVRRDLFLKYGGLQSKYLMFADRVMDVQLHRNGVKLGYATDSTVWHHNTEKLRELTAAVQSHIYGELLYRSDFPGSDVEYIGAAHEWLQRDVSMHSIAAVRLSALAQFIFWNAARLSRRSMLLPSVGEAADLWMIKSVGSKWLLFKAWLMLWYSTYEIWSLRFDLERCFPVFRRHWSKVVPRYFRRRFIAEMKGRTEPIPPRRELFEMGDDLEDYLVGFYELEQTGGRYFRWSERIAVVRIVVPSGNYRVDVEIMECRPPELQPYLMAFFDNRDLGPPLSNGRSTVISFLLRDEQFSRRKQVHHLALVCDSFCPGLFGSDDTRQLGLPIASIRFERILDGAGTQEGKVVGERQAESSKS